MSTYRTGNHWGVTIVREGDCAFCCIRSPGSTGCPIHQPAEAQLVAVVVNGDQALAERICALLNGIGPTAKAGPTEEACGKAHPNRRYTCQRRARHDVCVSWQSGNGSDAWVVDYDEMAAEIDRLNAELDQLRGTA